MGSLTDTQHDITVCYGSSLHCWEHDIDEIAGADTYRVCFECKHVYQTAAELEDAFYALMCEIPEPSQYPGTKRIPADQIFSCAYCLHDW